MKNFIHSKAERDRIKAEKEQKILSFLLDETYSTSEIVSLLLKTTQTTAYRTLKKMEKEDFVRLHEVEYALGRAGKQTIWGLTPTGALLAADMSDENFKVDYYEVGRVKPVTMSHSLALQRARVVAVHSGWVGWVSSRKLQQRAQRDRRTWIQIPDAIATSRSGVITAFELERTVKTPKRYNEILSNYAQMLLDQTLGEIIYICPQRIVKRLERLFMQIKTMVVNGQVMPVHEKVRKKMKFLTFDEWVQLNEY